MIVNPWLDVDPSERRWLVDKLMDTVGSETVRALMTDSVATVDADTLLVKAVREMLRNRVHHLPVVDQRDRAWRHRESAGLTCRCATQ